MFNITILKMKDIIKYLFGGILTIVIVVCLSKYLKSNKKEKNENLLKLEKIEFGNLKECLDTTIPTMSNLNEKNSSIETEDKQITSKKYLEDFLKTEISSIKGIEKIENSDKIEKSSMEESIIDENVNKQEETEEDISLAKLDNIQTEVVTQNPISENYNVQYKSVKIKNQTTYTLTEEVLNPDIKIENKNILIFHTHTCESYTSSDKFPYTPTGNFRTTDLNYTVARVGTELENYLKKYNLDVLHDTTFHDYPSYNGSYTNSLATVENILKTRSSDIIIDLHRDAIGSRPDYAPTVKIGDDFAAQIMFVIGTNEGGLYHPNWNENLRFAVKIQEKAEEMYPGLFKPIMVTKSRYNQHAGKFASIIEVGSTGNTLEQCLTSMKYLSAVINEILK